MFYICALDQYCLSIFEDEKVIGLNECLELWKEVASMQWFKKTKMVVLLNKTDLFRESLKYTQLGFCFGDEYKGKNYHDIAGIPKIVIKRITKEYILKDINIDIDIDMDVISIIGMYCDIRDDYWLQQVYQDGVQFIRQKFIDIRSDISIYEVCAIHPDEIQSVIYQVRNELIAERENSSGLLV